MVSSVLQMADGDDYDDAFDLILMVVMITTKGNGFNYDDNDDVRERLSQNQQAVDYGHESYDDNNAVIHDDDDDDDDDEEDDDDDSRGW